MDWECLKCYISPCSCNSYGSHASPAHLRKPWPMVATPNNQIPNPFLPQKIKIPKWSSNAQPKKPHLGASPSWSSCSTCERVVILRPCVRIPHDHRKGWPGGQDWQPPLAAEACGAVGVGQRSRHAHHVGENAELHVATDVTAGRVNEPTPPSKVH